ncbi:MAG: DUF3048 domain-containing protein [Chloroflexi bacterium]|nr:DUF3048 domain-containing protein [Chloroflexota bacterium]
MRRLTFTLIFAGVLIALLTVAVWPGGIRRAAGQDAPTALPTNTPRPTITPTFTPPPTNTPRPTATLTFTFTPTATNTPTNTATFTPSPTLTFTPSPTPTFVGPDEYPDNFNPLTGLPYPDEAARSRRTLIVKVSNYPEVVRPQSGLDKADIVFEYEVEGAVTRFAAIYRSQGTDKVGSIRSARLIDLELVPMFQALLAYSGANAWIDQYILDADWKWQAFSPQHGVNCPPFCRIEEPGKAFEHTLFGNTFDMWQVATDRQVNEGFLVHGFAFSDVPDTGGKPAVDIFVDFWSPYQDTRWQYNAQDGRYYRWNNELPHVDAVTGKQLAADNIVVLEAEHIDRPDILDSEIGGVVIETVLWGRGTAWLFRDGQWFEGIWAHAQGRSGLWLLFNDGQTPMHLKPGQTWFEVVRPVMYGVTVSEQLADMQAISAAIMATRTQVYNETATAIAPYVTPLPITPTPTTEMIP